MQPTDGQNTGRFHLMSQDLKRDFRLHRLLYAHYHRRSMGYL